jgi:hypothetical protein
MCNFGFWGVAALCVEVLSVYIAVTIFSVNDTKEGCCLRYVYYIYLQYMMQLLAVHLLNPVINLEDGGNTFLQNVGKSLQDCMVPHPRRQYS